MLKKARLSDRLSGLVDAIFADQTKAAIHERLRALISGDYALVRSETLHHNPTVNTLAVSELGLLGLAGQRERDDVEPVRFGRIGPQAIVSSTFAGVDCCILPVHATMRKLAISEFA